MPNAVAVREPKPPLVTGGSVAAIIPRSVEEMFRVAGAMVASGLTPNTLKTPEQVMVAIMAGAELGLPPFQALQSFAVINGRPAIWGDGMIAVVRSNGFQVKEWLEGDGDGMVAWCTVTRPDNGEEITRSFSVADAKKANLWGKAGPWQTSPKRMLQMRARGFACRDGASDVLRGFQLREEVEDYTTIREVAHGATVEGTGMRQRLEGRSAVGGFDAEYVGRQIDEALDGDAIPAEFAPAATETDPPTADDTFPGDRTSSTTTRAPTGEETQPVGEGGAEFDPVEWAADANHKIENFATVAEIDAFTASSETTAEFGRLTAHSPGLAKTLEAQLNGKRKALWHREQQRAADAAQAGQ